MSLILRLVWPLAIALLLAAACAAAPEPPDPPGATLDELRSRLPDLQRQVENWRMRKFNAPLRLEIREPDEERIAGWYDSQEKRLFVSPRAKGRFLHGVLLHEVVHALQDQLFGLVRVRERLGDDPAAQDAMDAIVEGEAMLAVVELLNYDFEGHAGERSEAESTEDDSKARPLNLYLEGMRFVRAVRDTRGWEGVDALYAKPPKTREEIRDASLYLE